MTTVPTHTVSMDDFECVAQEVQSPIPYVKNRWDEVKIAEGQNRHYMRKGQDLRQLTFTSKFKGDPIGTNEKLAKLTNKVIEFSSVYLGSFSARMEYNWKIEDGTKYSMVVSFSIQEV